MKHIFVRQTRPEDAEAFVQYETGTPNNLFDSDAASYRTSFSLCAYDKRGPLVFVPVQQPFFMESLGIRPGLGEIDTAVALKELTQALVTQAHFSGVGEIYFLCKDESTIDYAKRQGFEELPWRMCRVKLKDLEP